MSQGRSSSSAPGPGPSPRLNTAQRPKMDGRGTLKLSENNGNGIDEINHAN